MNNLSSDLLAAAGVGRITLHMLSRTHTVTHKRKDGGLLWIHLTVVEQHEHKVSCHARPTGSGHFSETTMVFVNLLIHMQQMSQNSSDNSSSRCVWHGIVVQEICPDMLYSTGIRVHAYFALQISYLLLWLVYTFPICGQLISLVSCWYRQGHNVMPFDLLLDWWNKTLVLL